MARQWIRQIKLIVTTTSKQLDLSEMQIRFETTAAQLSNTLRTLQLRIWNPKNETAKLIINEGEHIEVVAGYIGNFGTIFRGPIVQTRYGRENGTDSYLDISAVDGDTFYNEGFVAKTITKGSTENGRVRHIVPAASGEVGYIPPESTTKKLPRGRTYYGLARDHLTNLSATMGSQWVINDGKVEIIPVSAYKPDQVPEISFDTGMIGVPVQTNEGITIKILLNPSIKRGSLIHLNNQALIQQKQADLSRQGTAEYGLTTPPIAKDGYYKVETATHKGDTKDQDWYTDIACSSFADGMITRDQLKVQIDYPPVRN